MAMTNATLQGHPPIYIVENDLLGNGVPAILSIHSTLKGAESAAQQRRKDKPEETFIVRKIQLPK